jgi:K+-sensing histidine kinase KdpD
VALVKWLSAISQNFRAGMPGPESSSATRRLLISGCFTLLLVAAATVTIFIFKGLITGINLVTIVYLIPVLLAAIWWGTGPAILAAFAGALAADFFFYPPLYTFRIEDPQNLADFFAFLFVALVTGTLTGSLRRHEKESQDLYEYSKRLAASFTITNLIRATEDYLSKSLGRRAILIPRKVIDDGTGEGSVLPSQVRRKAIALRPESGTERVIDETGRHVWLIRDVQFGDLDCIVAVDLGVGPLGFTRRFNRHIDAVLAEATDNLMRLDLANVIAEFRNQSQSDALKSALVAHVSHDLRNPLVSIVGAASVLEQMREITSDARARSLVTAVHEEASRLDSEIQNLVDAARITAGAEEPKREPVDLVDVIRTAIGQRKMQLASHQLEVDLPGDLPFIRAESGLLAKAVAQLLDNATKYSPAASKIHIAARADQDWVVLSIADEGIGLTDEERAKAGQRSFRGSRHPAIRGSGLGLWIANTFVAANAGRLSAESPGPGLGATFRIHLERAQ